MRRFTILLSGLCLWAIAASAQAVGVVSEQIYFVEKDGRHALVYTTSRTDYANYSMWFQNKQGFQPNDYLTEFLYLYPNEVSWDTSSKPGFSLLKLPDGDFASLERVSLEDGGALKVSADGDYAFNNWPGQTKTPDGHYGLWNHPDAFSKVAYSWVFPDNLEPVEYSSNREGEWVRRHNTVTYYGSGVNDVVFDLKYRPSSHDTYDALKGKMAGQEGVQVEQTPEGVKLTVAATVLYPSGVAALSEQGKSILAKVAETLKERTGVDVIVAGHTDNDPIGPGLIHKFPSNWELGALRSINVIHFLAASGVEESRFESQSFSFYRPVDTNDTEEGQAKNRRIELLLVENGSK